jgi:hypothetical protein
VTEGDLYIYGVLAAREAAWAACPGLFGGKVTTLQAGDLAALVSEAGQDPIARTRRNMLAHTSVLECAMAQATILPLRFGTVAPGAGALCACIAANRSAFRGALRDIDGQVELGLKASWRTGVVFNDIVDQDHGLRQLRDRLRSRPAGETYYERIELGRRVEAALSSRRASDAAAIMSELLPLAERNAELRTHDEDMILNHAFLVRRDAESDFDAAVARIAERFGDRMEFRYVGPVPPFNFVNVQADWLFAAAAKVPG